MNVTKNSQPVVKVIHGLNSIPGWIFRGLLFNDDQDLTKILAKILAKILINKILEDYSRSLTKILKML